MSDEKRYVYAVDEFLGRYRIDRAEVIKETAKIVYVRERLLCFGSLTRLRKGMGQYDETPEAAVMRFQARMRAKREEAARKLEAFDNALAHSFDDDPVMVEWRGERWATTTAIR